MPARCAAGIGVTRHRGSWLTTGRRTGEIGSCSATRKTFGAFAIHPATIDTSNGWSKNNVLILFSLGYKGVIGMFSFGWAQMVLAGYLAIVSCGPPVVRAAMIRQGATGFVPWREFWSKWGAGFAVRLALAAVLYWGGFWS